MLIGLILSHFACFQILLNSLVSNRGRENVKWYVNISIFVGQNLNAARTDVSMHGV